MARKGENIRKRNDGRWEARFIKSRDSYGRAVYGYVYGKSYREAREKKNTAIVCISNESNTKQYNESINFEILAKRWLQMKEVKVKASTLEKYRYMIERYLLPKASHIVLKDLTAGDIDRILFEIYKADDMALSVSTMRTIVYITKSMLNYGRTTTDIPPVYCSFKLPTNNQADICVFSDEEEKQLFAYIERNPIRPHIGIAICLYSGLRIGEICALKGKDIDLEKNTLSVSKTVQRLHIDREEGQKTRLVVDAPKSYKSIRKIPIPSFLAEFLKENEIGLTDEKCYLMSNSNKAYDPRTMHNYYKRCLEHIGIPDRKFHCLRHTFATNCIKLGFDVKTLSELLGHSDVSITLNKYVHIDMDIKRRQMEMFSDRSGKNYGHIDKQTLVL